MKSWSAGYLASSKTIPLPGQLSQLMRFGLRLIVGFTVGIIVGFIVGFTVRFTVGFTVGA